MTQVITLETSADIHRVRGELQRLGAWAQAVADSVGEARALTLSAHSQPVPIADLRSIPGVADVLSPPSPHPLLDGLRGRSVSVGAWEIGGGHSPVLAAGPCSAESEEQVHLTASLVARAGGTILRGGAFKPRTSPYAFSGHGRPALGWLGDAAKAHGLALVTEVLSEPEVDWVAAVADILQVGSRNMQNFALLQAVGRAGKPVLIKRGRSASVSEWRLAAEHALWGGAASVILCERGVSQASPEMRNTLDLAAVALIKHVDGLPVWVDPSHGVGRRDLVLPLCRAALAAGADGLLVEAHPDPRRALSDGAQALDPAELLTLGAELFS